ncbi:MAG: HEAT repeat domain-containing protein [Gemmatimonadaceae bacterium]|nr:HEAT repeat domain-containing protein [Gemmatimonadaceae bacterium]
MASPTGAPAQSEESADPPPFAAAIVTDVLKTFSKAVRAHALYLPNNPMHARSMEAARAAFQGLWQQTDEVVLLVGETQFRWEELVVYEEAEKSTENLAWVFYKDGLREIKICKGFEMTDMDPIMEIIQRVRSATADDDDLLTILWEQEFATFEYKYVGAGGGGGDTPYDPMEAGATPDRLPPPGEVERGGSDQLVSSAKPAGVVSMDDFDSTLYFLDEREIEYIHNEIAKDYSADLRPLVIASLLDTFETQLDVGVREEIARILDGVLINLLSSNQVRTVAYLLREVALTSQRAKEMTEVQVQRFADLPERLSEGAVLGQLLETLDETPLFPPQGDISELFLQLRPSALETVFGFTPRSHNRELCQLLENSADRLAASHTSELVRLITVPDSVVAQEAIQRAAVMKTAAAVPALGQVMSTGVDSSMRLAAVLALADIGSPGALQVLEKCVEDEERDVRVAAVRALGGRAYRPALPRVEKALKGKPLRDSNLTEKMAFFEAYGSLAGDSGVEFLDSVLNGKGTFGKREEPEFRACAAMALGKVNTRRARESLDKATGDKDAVVKNAVTRAVRGVAA